MSLAEQSQQWYPTSVQVTVHQARSLRIKGKNGTNDAYAIIQVAKDKFSTTVAEKCVAPVWKEEASFDLPLFHPGNAERCTLYIIVMHRAQVGLDKFLGQAVINLLDLHDNSTHKKTDWFKMVDKSGKEDKARGEVLLDIQFMRSNMSASMLDLSMQDKPRSRISKLKDKVRGNKKSGFSDSVSAIVPSSNQVLTDSEGEADAQSLNQSTEGKKKSKLKTLFAPKSNLQRNISQSMSTLGTFPEKNSSLSGSRSSGLNVDSPDVKKKFKFQVHKRTGSSDSKGSQGPFSLLGRSKLSNNDQNNLCINGSHVYAEEAESKSGSTLSLNSSGQGSVVDLHKQSSDASPDFSKSIPVPSVKVETEDRAMLEQQRHQAEEERRQAEERRTAEAKRLEDEGKRKAEAKRLQEEKERRYQEEQERKRHFLEDEARRKKQREEEEKRIKQEEERRMLEAAETQRLQEERHRVEEQKKQEEASMNDRLTSLFGMIKKKEEKKEEVLPKELTAPASAPRNPLQPNSHHSTNPFDEIPLSSDLPANSNDNPADQQILDHNTQTPSAMVFLNRTAKVSAVKPRLNQSQDSESTDCQAPSQLCQSPANSPLSSIPTESLDTFSKLHPSLALPHKSLFGSPRGTIENLSTVGSSPTMADNRKTALLPSDAGENVHVREIKNPAYVETDGLQEKKRISLPLPDYETLFPKKRHGVQGQTQWDHLIAEVNQKHRDIPSQFLEMSVDGPEEEELNTKSSISQVSPAIKHYQIHQQETKPIPTKTVAPPAPPKPVTQETKPISTKTVAPPAPPKPVTQETKPISTKTVAPPAPSKRVIDSHPQAAADSNQKQSQSIARHSLLRPNSPTVPGPVTTKSSGRENLAGIPRDGASKVFLSPETTHATTTPTTTLPAGKIKAQVAMAKEAPSAKPRQKVSGKELTQQKEPAVTPNNSTDGNIQTLSSSSVSSRDKKSEQVADFADFNPFPSSELLSKDPWAPPMQKQEVDDIFTSKKNLREPEDQGVIDEFDKNISQQKATDPFSGFIDSDSNKDSENRMDEDSKHTSPVFQTRNLQRPRKTLSHSTLSYNKGSKAQDKGLTITTASEDLNAPVTLKPQNSVTTQSSFYEEDLFGAVPFTVASGPSSSQPLQVVLEEPVSQAGGLSGGKTLLRAWVSPSEISPVSAQNSNGGGLALTPRRPHPVKPLSSVEIQHPTIAPPVKELKVKDITLQKIKLTESIETGPYTQLTQDELITLVVRQQTDLSRKDAKIVELEEYIDNLLVRVIDEKPSILQSLNAAKPV